MFLLVIVNFAIDLTIFLLIVDYQTWNWNEADSAEQADTVEGASRSSPSHDSALRVCSTEEHYIKWEKLLRARYGVFRL